MVKNLDCQIIPVSQHGITKDRIDKDALAILNKLESAGFQAYLVGGCLRDLISNKDPKDTDVVTNAKPEQIKKVFKRSILVGKRFPLVHVRVAGKRYKIIEVATFRTKYADYKSRFKFMRWLTQYFVYGNIEQDVMRRDITAQALYWRSCDAAIIDYHGGYEHAKNKKLVIIGNPSDRFLEDPVRILRVIRVWSKLGFTIDAETNEAIKQSKSLLSEVAPARMFGEIVRSFHGGFGRQFARALIKYRLHSIILPHAITSKKSEQWLLNGLAEADARLNSGKTLSAGYLFALLLWPSYIKSNANSKKFSIKNARKIIMRQHAISSIPKKHVQMIESIWRMQILLVNVDSVEKANKLRQHQFFRAAYDFLLLRAQFKPDLKLLADKWTEFISMPESEMTSFDFNRHPEEAK